MAELSKMEPGRKKSRRAGGLGTLGIFQVDDRLDAHALTKDLLISVADTVIVVVLIHLGVLAAPELAAKDR